MRVLSHRPAPRLILAPLSSLMAILAACARSPSVAELKNGAEPLIKAIEESKAANGHYPKSLMEAGVVSPSTPFGEWRYHPIDGDNFGKEEDMFEIALGNYGEDGFVQTYDSETGWNMDQ